MAQTTVVQPGTNTNPDQGGTSAVSSATNTGHGSTTCNATGVTDHVQRSCRWSAFTSGPAVAVRTSVTLKVSFVRDGTLSDGGIDTFNAFQLEYSLNGGSSWTAIRSDQFITSSSSGTNSVSLSLSQDLTQVQVRDFLDALKSGGETATLTATVSNIQIEVVTQDNPLPIVVI